MTAPRVFGCDYQFLSCGSVFTDGLAHAADELGIVYQHADWSRVDLASIRTFNPDLVLVVHGRKCRADLRAFNSAVWLLDEPYEVDDTSTFSARYQHVFVNDAATLARHANATYLPVCYDPAVHRPGPTWLTRQHIVGFVGGGNSTRDAYLSALAGEGFLSYVVGGPWIEPSLQRLCLSRNIEATATAAIYQSTRIVINVFREKHHYNAQHVPATAMNPRIYEALACGALVVSEWRPEIEALVPELPTFRSVEECVELVADLVADPDRVARLQAQCAKRLQAHTYADRLRTVLRVALQAEVAA